VAVRHSIPAQTATCVTSYRKFLACKRRSKRLLITSTAWGFLEEFMLEDVENRKGTSRPDSEAPKPSDEELMSQVQRGDGDAFAALFDRHHRLVLTIALRILHDAGEAQEVTQNIFFELYRTAGRFDVHRGTLKVWLLQFAYHRSINRRNYLVLRQFYNRPDLDEVMEWEASAHSAPRVPIPELKQLAEELLSTLNDVQRRTIERVIFEGLTLREVAEQTGESYSAVRNHYYRGLQHLRVCLTAQPERVRVERAVDLGGLGEVSRGRA
jgi:RNA polymerase sigma-70 factor, ECF subfamily